MTTHSSILKTPGVSAGQGRLAHCGPWGRKALDKTELLNNDKKFPEPRGVLGAQTRACTSRNNAQNRAIGLCGEDNSAAIIRGWAPHCHFWVKN